MKTILLSAAASIALLGAAAASEGAGDPFGRAGERSSFAVAVPAVDTGSQQYPAAQGTGASDLAVQAPRFNPALLTQPDTGSQQMPVGLR
jgi:hypothetical protein